MRLAEGVVDSDPIEREERGHRTGNARKETQDPEEE